MIKLSYKSLALAIVASLAAPLAFAQEASTEATAEVAPTEQAAMPTETDATAAQAMSETDAAAPQAMSWNDVDADKDGALSQTEAVAVPALVEVFVEADADADGTLTPEEYQTYVAKVQTEGSAGSGGGASGQ